MLRETLFGFAFISACLIASSAYAGKVELTTYYPAPYGEYKDVTTSNRLQIPVKPVGGDITKVTVGEIWVEGPCPTGQTWNNSTGACG